VARLFHALWNRCHAFSATPASLAGCAERRCCHHSTLYKPPRRYRLRVGDGDGVSQSVLKVPRRSATEKLKRISLITPEYVGIGSEVESYSYVQRATLSAVERLCHRPPSGRGPVPV